MTAPIQPRRSTHADRWERNGRIFAELAKGATLAEISERCRVPLSSAGNIVVEVRAACRAIVADESASIWAVICRDIQDTLGAELAADFCGVHTDRFRAWSLGTQAPTAKDQERVRLLLAAKWTIEMRRAGLEYGAIDDLADDLVHRRAANAGERKR